MPHEIVMIHQMGDALRNTGYKNIESAVSEIIDNAIEAKANDVFLLVLEDINPSTGRRFVTDIAFLDNGTGMTVDQLGSCLGIGFTTRADRKGLGRFGVGLPQSSLYACPSVDVYSWQNGYDNCKKVYLDINLVKSGHQTQIDDPINCEIPSQFKSFLKYRTEKRDYDFTQNGTLVHWKNCDRVSPKTVGFLFPTLEFSLGQKFRYLIKDGTHNIKIISLQNPSHAIDVLPNDPMFLMKPNYVLGNITKPGIIQKRDNINFTEPLFEPYANERCQDGVVKVPVKYLDKDTREVKQSQVEVAFSKVRGVFYDKTALAKDPGATDMGKHVAKMEGISIVRAKREIDFGVFDFYKNINQPTHRWWGCEVRFEPELDEAFGVANNKQHVELRELDKDDYSEDEVLPMWIQLYPVIHNTISTIYKENSATRDKSRVIEDIMTPTVVIINTVEEANDKKGETDLNRENTSEEDLFNKNKSELQQHGMSEVTAEEVIRFMSNKVNIIYKDSKRGPFFDYSFALGSCQIEINTSHQFYQRFLLPLADNPEFKTAFELFLASFVKVIDEFVGEQREYSDTLVVEWNNKLFRYVTELYGSESR